MLKYHNFDSEDGTPVEIRFNGIKLDIEDKLGREFISSMRNTYFALFDLISLTDMDVIKKKLMKNKIKSISINIWGHLMNEYADQKNTAVFIDSLSSSGMILSDLDSFVGFAFSDIKANNYFITEAMKIFSSNIYGLSIIDS